MPDNERFLGKRAWFFPTSAVAVWLAETAGKRPSDAVNAALEEHIRRQQTEATLLDILAEIAASLAAIRGLLEASHLP